MQDQSKICISSMLRRRRVVPMRWPTMGALSVASTRPIPCMPNKVMYSNNPATTSSFPTNSAKTAALASTPFREKSRSSLKKELNWGKTALNRGHPCFRLTRGLKLYRSLMCWGQRLFSNLTGKWQYHWVVLAFTIMIWHEIQSVSRHKFW